MASSIDFTEIVKATVAAQAATAHIPAMVREEIAKGWRQLPNAEAERSPKSWFFDPLSLQYSLGYKDRRYSVTFDTLKRIAAQLAVISAIVNTRSAQVAAFTQPYRWTKSLGFIIRHKDPDHRTTPAEVAFIKELEQFVLNCGRAEPNPFSTVQRDDLDAFIRKIVRDSLTYDQCAAEIVYDRSGLPYEFYAVDATTIRYASDDRYTGINSSYTDRPGFVPSIPSRTSGLHEGRQYGYQTASGQAVRYMQIVNGQIQNVYGDRDLAFGIRNPRTDLYIQGYGYGELEQLITIVTAHLNAESYNSKFFTQGSTPKGILNLKGDNWTPDMLEGFKRQWASNVAGVENSWRTPILQSEGLDWVPLAQSNQEMEFGRWMEYLLKVSCGVYLIDPAEINFDLHGGVQQTPLFESSQEWKLKASRDRGLKPLLRFLAKMLNKNIIDRIDDHFTLEFAGLDEMSEQEKHEMTIEQISSYKTLNEARRTMDLPDLPFGDVPMNPVYFTAMQAQQEADAAAQGVEPGAEGAAPGAEEQPQESDSPAEPQYSGHYGLADAGAGGDQ